MSIWSKFTGKLNEVVDSVGKAIDDNVTNDEEKLILRNELQNMLLGAELEASKLELEHEKELTKRHQYDMTSDDKLSKRIRPYTLIFLLFITTILALTDGNISFDYSRLVDGVETVKHYSFVIKESWVDLYTMMSVAAVGFYFGGRSLEKATKIKSGK